VWYGRSIIRSSYKLTYEAAQDIINGKPFEEVISQVPELLIKNEKAAKKNLKNLRESLLLLRRYEIKQLTIATTCGSNRT